MKYLITGGAGFIGSHLADKLIEQGHDVHIVDNLSTGRLANIQHLVGNEHFKSTIADILDYHMLEQLVAQCDQIFHMAAAVGVKLIMEKPVETITTNVGGTENVLKLAVNYDKKVFIASTSEVYGKKMEFDEEVHGLNEEHDIILGPTNKRRWAYACTKAMDEFLALAYYDEKRLPVVIARYFNTVGPRQTEQYGMVVPNFVQRALLNEPIYVHGDGEQTRSFTHVKDAVEATIDLMNHSQAEGQVFNIGHGHEISMNDLAKTVCQMTHSSSEIILVPYTKAYGKGFEDMRRRTPDISKLKNTVGYEPSRPIDEILKAVVDFYRKENSGLVAL
ncbi:MAG: GDP-mannose 4,6-dehydratase [SAR324 cluster bacterium]|nr:GDP-mannose 4,6-dehydratase [SAR324 cluster bacterium]